MIPRLVPRPICDRRWRRRSRFFSHFQSDRKLPIPIHFIRPSTRPPVPVRVRPSRLRSARRVNERARSRHGRAGTSYGLSKDDDDEDTHRTTHASGGGRRRSSQSLPSLIHRISLDINDQRLLTLIRIPCSTSILRGPRMERGQRPRHPMRQRLDRRSSSVGGGHGRPLRPLRPTSGGSHRRRRLPLLLRFHKSQAEAVEWRGRGEEKERLGELAGDGGGGGGREGGRGRESWLRHKICHRRQLSWAA